MSGRAVVVTALFLVSLAAAAATGEQLFFNLTYLWGGLLVLAFIWSKLSLRGVQLKRHTGSARAQVGHLLREEFVVTNYGRLPKLWLDIRDMTEFPGYRATSLTGLGLFGPSDLVGHSGSSVVAGLGPDERWSWTARTVCTQRGRYALGPTEIHGGDPFGLFPASVRLPASQHVVVLPAIFPVRRYPVPTGRLPGGEALRQRTHQVTPNASGVRDYRPGDSLNRIHWRSTAKWDRLIVKEFEFDPLADVWIVVDAARAAQHGPVEEDRSAEARIEAGPDAARQPLGVTTEYAVTLAASLAFHFTERDRGVGLIAHGLSRHVVQPERGQSQLYRLLETLAVLDAQGEHSLDEVLKIEAGLIPRGATAILITADANPALATIARELLRVGKTADFVLLEAQSFGGPLGSRALARTLQRSGLRAWLVRRGDDLAGVFHPQHLAEERLQAAR